MVKRFYRQLAENILLALNTFILILLVCGSLVTIPVWLQPVGRMHPLVLHFPIVLIMLSMLPELFRFTRHYTKEPAYAAISSVLLLAAALFSSLTVIMGLFLSHESGYTGSVLLWHKFTGVAIAFLASFIYHYRLKPWYTSLVARLAAVIMLFTVTLAGHYGATLSHGENFVLAPVTAAPAKVPLEKAMVYSDVIRPALEKCTGCHNNDKAKGDLILTDIESILKGGKSGALFIPGKPEISLLLRRIHLNDDDKKHMPPAGKPQLTDIESKMLYYWIAGNTDLHKKVTELASGDSLRLLAAKLLKPSAEDDSYDFSAADPKLIKSLNTNYRVINPLASESPALAITIYNKSAYTPRLLEELSPVASQIVTLNLSKMPVRDAALKTIASFINLRRLNLNFSDLSGNGLEQLSTLKHLQSLSLSGTELNAGALKSIGKLNHLTELAVWDTGLKPEALAAFVKTRPMIQLIRGYQEDGRKLKLPAPILLNSSPVFKENFTLLFSRPLRGTEIRYTTDGTAPDSLHSPVYKPGLQFNREIKIRAQAFKPGWISSDTVSFSFYRSLHRPDSIWLHSTPEESYSADGGKTLADEQLGSSNIAISWLGYKSHPMELYCYYSVASNVSSVSLHTVVYPEALWVTPSHIEIWGGKDLQHLSLITSLHPDTIKRQNKPMFTAINCRFRPHLVNYLKIIAMPGSLPYPKPEVQKKQTPAELIRLAKATLRTKDSLTHAVRDSLALATLVNGPPDPDKNSKLTSAAVFAAKGIDKKHKASDPRELAAQAAARATAEKKIAMNAAVAKIRQAKLNLRQALQEESALTRKVRKPVLVSTRGTMLFDEVFIN